MKLGEKFLSILMTICLTANAALAGNALLPVGDIGVMHNLTLNYVEGSRAVTGASPKDYRATMAAIRAFLVTERGLSARSVDQTIARVTRMLQAADAFAPGGNRLRPVVAFADTLIDQRVLSGALGAELGAELSHIVQMSSDPANSAQAIVGYVNREFATRDWGADAAVAEVFVDVANHSYAYWTTEQEGPAGSTVGSVILDDAFGAVTGALWFGPIGAIVVGAAMSLDEHEND